MGKKLIIGRERLVSACEPDSATASRRRVRASLVFAAALATLGPGCNRERPDAGARGGPPTTYEGVDADIREIFDAGEERPFGPGGPRFALDASLYAKVGEKPDVALTVLERKLESKNGIVRCNAYDFLAHLCGDGVVGEKARELLAEGRMDESAAVRQFIDLQLRKSDR